MIIKNSKIETPLFSIITSTFNPGFSIVKTIESLNVQSFTQFEWVVVDGCSQDSTINIIQEMANCDYILISEKDTGIYNAWNKGVKFCRGKWVLFVGSGDRLFPDVLWFLYKNINNVRDQINFVYGGILLTGCGVQKLRKSMVNLGEWDLGLPVLPPHPSVLHRSVIFNETNMFDESYKIAADSKFLIKNMNDKNSMFIDVLIVDMEIGGISSRPSSWQIIANEKNRICDELELKKPKWYTRIRDIKLIIKPFLYFLLFKPIDLILKK